jgi:hypothetical protein
MTQKKFIPFDPESIQRKRERLEDALDGTFDPSSEDYVIPKNRSPDLIEKHLFDFPDGTRIVVSRHTTGEHGPVIHGHARWVEGRRPTERAEALLKLCRHMEDLLVALPGAGDSTDPSTAAPDVLQYGMSEEEDRPHIFFEYPSPAFDSA